MKSVANVRGTMRALEAAELRAFLLAGTRTAKVAVVRRDGSPLVTPVWFLLDEDGSIMFETGRSSVKGRALSRDPRVSICVEDDEPPFGFVRVDGIAELSDDQDELLSGRSGSPHATWVTIARKSSVVETQLRARCWCGCDPIVSSRRSSWPTETADPEAVGQIDPLPDAQARQPVRSACRELLRWTEAGARTCRASWPEGAGTPSGLHRTEPPGRVGLETRSPQGVHTEVDKRATTRRQGDRIREAIVDLQDAYEQMTLGACASIRRVMRPARRRRLRVGS